jgi:hypothetical protein
MTLPRPGFSANRTAGLRPCVRPGVLPGVLRLSASRCPRLILTFAVGSEQIIEPARKQCFDEAANAAGKTHQAGSSARPLGRARPESLRRFSQRGSARQVSGSPSPSSGPLPFAGVRLLSKGRRTLSAVSGVLDADVGVLQAQVLFVRERADVGAYNKIGRDFRQLEVDPHLVVAVVHHLLPELLGFGRV